MSHPLMCWDISEYEEIKQIMKEIIELGIIEFRPLRLSNKALALLGEAVNKLMKEKKPEEIKYTEIALEITKAYTDDEEKARRMACVLAFWIMFKMSYDQIMHTAEIVREGRLKAETKPQAVGSGAVGSTHASPTNAHRRTTNESYPPDLSRRGEKEGGR